MEQDVYFKKIIRFRYSGQVLQFRVSQDLFSSYDVDIGTQRLLRSLAGEAAGGFRKVLDLGCGYGPIGLALKKADAERVVHMVDRDALAVAYARRNAELNGLSGLQVYGSLGYDDVAEVGFDLVVSNIPAGAGEPVISHLLRDAVYHLEPGGTVAVVVVTVLEPTVAAVLDDPAIEVCLRKPWPGHTVFHYRFAGRTAPAARPAGSALERGVYDRGRVTASLGGLEFPMDVAYGLPGFDGLDPRTALLVEGLSGIPGLAVRRAAVLNPGQGYVPVALWKLLGPAEILLVDRDLLGLRYSRKNLVLNGCPEASISLCHQVGMSAPGSGPADLVVGVLREEEGPAAVALTVEQAAGGVSPGGTIVVAASSTAVTRLVKALQPGKLLRVVRRERRRGNSLLVLRRG